MSNTHNKLRQIEENKKLKIELEKCNSSSPKKTKSEGLFSRILNTVDSVLSGGFRPVRDIETSEISETTNSLETLRLISTSL